MKLKIFGTLAALMLSVVVFAQQDKKTLDRATNRMENMCQTVNLSPEAKEKAIQRTYEFMLEYSAKVTRPRQQGTASKEEIAAANKTITSAYRKDLKALIPDDQMEAYEKWTKLPIQERDRKVTPGK